MTSEAKKIRLFVGTFLPPEDQQRIAKWSELDTRLGEFWHRKIRWSKPEKLHMTWAFLGLHEPAIVDEVNTVLDERLQGQSSVSITYEKPTFWSSPVDANLMVLTPNTVSNDFTALAEKVRKSMMPFMEKQEHKFRPHLTVMRFSSTRRDKMRFTIPDWFDLSGVLPLTHKLEEISLIQSHMGQDRYEALRTWKLTN
jgi:2'-5' RNA ligase